MNPFLVVGRISIVIDFDDEFRALRAGGDVLGLRRRSLSPVT